MKAEVDSNAVRLKTQNTAEALGNGENETVLKELSVAKMLRCRVRYFADGAVIGSMEFVNEAFRGLRSGVSCQRFPWAPKARVRTRR